MTSPQEQAFASGEIIPPPPSPRPNHLPIGGVSGTAQADGGEIIPPPPPPRSNYLPMGGVTGIPQTDGARSVPPPPPPPPQLSRQSFIAQLAPPPPPPLPPQPPALPLWPRQSFPAQSAQPMQRRSQVTTPSMQSPLVTGPQQQGPQHTSWQPTPYVLQWPKQIQPQHQQVQNGQTTNPSPLAATASFPSSDDGYRRKDARATVNRIVALMNPPKDEQEYAFVGLSTGHQKKLTTRNDPVAFCDKLKKVMAGEEGGIWAMPEDQTTVDGISTLPQADYLTPMRVECFMKLVSPNLATRAAMIPNTMVEVYPVQGGRAILPFHEVSKQGGTRDTARYALRNIKLTKGEAWMSASTRLVLHMRAALVDHTKPYASEELYFWRFITEADLMTLVERALDLFLPPMLDRLSLESYLVLVQKDIKHSWPTCR